ncbi:MAG: starch-binding protein [Porphyromonadaceae bacterium]|nr:starch-binding protein [Porphyromonadaceae bacterium]
MKKIILSLFFVSFLILPNLYSQAPSQSTDVMLQAFYWNSFSDSKWTTLASQAGEISESFDLVWLPPSGDDNSSNTMGYLPVYWFRQNSSFGSQAELKALIAKLKAGGTRAVADIVINHRNGVTNWTNFPTETYNGVTYTPNMYWICSTDEVKDQPGQARPLGDPDEGENYEAARDLNHKNHDVQQAIKGYLHFMKNEIGYDGWRYDLTKGFPGRYVAMYNESANAYFSVGEYWENNYDDLEAWLNNANKKSTTFDFTFKYALNEWANSGDLTKLVWYFLNKDPQPAGLIHNPDLKRYASTFIDNHDTYRDHNKFNGNVLMANAFMLSSPGIPCVFLPHWQQHKSEIKAMITARKSVGIHSESPVKVDQSSRELYVATVTGKSGSLIVKLGSGNYSAPGNYTLAASGNNYAIWTSGGGLNVSGNPSSGTYGIGQTVTLTANPSTASIYYTTDGSTPSVGSTKYNGSISLPNGSTTLKAIAINSSGSSPVMTYNYTISNQPAGKITVSFKAPDSWSQVGLYVWQVDGGNVNELLGGWPGITVSKDKAGFYSYDVSGYKGNEINVIFNNNNNNEQTYDLTASSNICWISGNSTPEGANIKYTVSVVDCATSVKNLNLISWRLYPNPSNGIVNIDLENNVKRVEVISVLGTKVLSIEQNVNQLDLTAYPSGLYYISVTDVEGNKLSKALYKK